MMMVMKPIRLFNCVHGSMVGFACFVCSLYLRQSDGGYVAERLLQPCPVPVYLHTSSSLSCYCFSMQCPASVLKYIVLCIIFFKGYFLLYNLE